MKISVVGGFGFVGRNLINELLKKNYDEIVSIDIAKPDFEIKNYRYIPADTTSEGSWQDEIRTSDAVINLAGATIFKLWSKKYKDLIYKSRIDTTKNIVSAIDADRETVLISTSAAGYYGDRNSEALYEESTPGNDFLAEVCKDWEKEALKSEEKSTRLCIMRFGIVLGKDGGALSQMLPFARLMLNPVLGSGKNFFPWIHIEDLINACIFLLENKDARGAFNFTSPGFATQKEFTRTLGRVLCRPAYLSVPEFALKLFAGELGKSLVMSQKAIPQKLYDCGYKFRYDNIENALENLLK